MSAGITMQIIKKKYHDNVHKHEDIQVVIRNASLYWKPYKQYVNVNKKSVKLNGTMCS
jgi:hypothetical protein